MRTVGWIKRSDGLYAPSADARGLNAWHTPPGALATLRLSLKDPNRFVADFSPSPARPVPDFAWRLRRERVASFLGGLRSLLQVKQLLASMGNAGRYGRWEGVGSDDITEVWRGFCGALGDAGLSAVTGKIRLRYEHEGEFYEIAGLHGDTKWRGQEARVTWVEGGFKALALREKAGEATDGNPLPDGVLGFFAQDPKRDDQTSLSLVERLRWFEGFHGGNIFKVIDDKLRGLIAASAKRVQAHQLAQRRRFFLGSMEGTLTKWVWGHLTSSYIELPDGALYGPRGPVPGNCIGRFSYQGQSYLCLRVVEITGPGFAFVAEAGIEDINIEIARNGGGACGFE